ncbi:hypothetical protein GFY24_08380 [Nocardia sp. SYP-A9097]|uniref:hypothetical protein n=1 Tax=Nocardia sp. SYP-A9097 TaxID=2663237 RepID=UPI00129BFB70|nr:hypothetical protein [Nocardia sp. SYP-A9097]MRH87472.1 hypothetical protein [Nocardia sp. SYP-A9097]
MPGTNHILDKAFKDALARAASLDKQGIPPADTGELFPQRTPTNVELVQASAAFYHKHQAVMDKAVNDVVEFLDSPDGVAYVKALEGSFDSAAPNALSTEIASEILHNGEFDLASSHPQGLRGFGVGVSAGVSAVVGLLAGADVVFDFKDETQVHGRVWKGGSLKGGLSVSAGLELSFWVEKPVTGAIAGWLLDLYVQTKYIIVLFVRFMYINQRAEGSTELDFSGVSLQFPLGIGLPIRHSKGTDGVVAIFAATQTAFDRNKRATLQVVNKTTNVPTIAVKEIADLVVTLRNTSGHDVALSSGAAMTINMPSYFTDDDVSAMNIDYPGWTFTDVKSKLTLTLSKNSTWASNTDMSLVITNVKSSNQPPAGQQSYPGKVKVGLNDISFTAPIATVADFSLVWANSQAKLDWHADVTTDFKLTGNGSGSLTTYAQPGTTVVQLTTAVDKSGTSWVLGYIFNYNTNVGSQVIPQVTAAWVKADAVKLPGNAWYGVAVDVSGKPSVAWYGGSEQSGSSITVTPTFG